MSFTSWRGILIGKELHWKCSAPQGVACSSHVLSAKSVPHKGYNVYSLWGTFFILKSLVSGAFPAFAVAGRLFMLSHHRLRTLKNRIIQSFLCWNCNRGNSRLPKMSAIQPFMSTICNRMGKAVKKPQTETLYLVSRLRIVYMCHSISVPSFSLSMIFFLL